MYWLVLVFSGCLEAVWATALGLSEGMTKLVPTIVFIAGITGSMAGLAFALKGIPTGTAYAIWVGIGAAGTMIYAMLSGSESFSLVRVALIAVLISSVVGIKLVGE